MAARPRMITWRGRRFAFEPLTARGLIVPDAAPVFAVMRGGEFIGTMRGDPNDSLAQFETRCIEWLRDLLDQE